MSTFRKIIDKVAKPKELEGEDAAKTPSPGANSYVKAMLLRDMSDLDVVKNEISSGNVIIMRITPMVRKNVDDVKKVINELCDYVETIGGDIARLGEERIVVTPSSIKIWRSPPEAEPEATST